MASLLAVTALLAAVLSPLTGAQSAVIGPQSATPSAPLVPLVVAPSAPIAPEANGLTISSIAETTSGDNSVVINGEAITYTFAITNTGIAAGATNIKVFDSMPPDTFDQITCLGAIPCNRQIVTLFINNPLGGFIEVTKTSLLTWTVASLALNTTAAVSFRARVVGKSDGTVFYNNVFVSFDQGSPFQGQIITTTVRQKMPDLEAAACPLRRPGSHPTLVAHSLRRGETLTGMATRMYSGPTPTWVKRAAVTCCIGTMAAGSMRRRFGNPPSRSV